MKYLLISATAVMAITGAAAIGNAQMQDKGQGPGATGGGAGGGGPGAGGPGGGAAERSPSGGGAERSPGAGEKAQQPSRDQKSQPGKGAEGQPGKSEPRAAQQPDDRKMDRKSSSEQGMRDKDTKKSADQPQRDDQKKAADERQRDKDMKRSADQQRQQDQKKSADQQRQQQRDEKKATDQQRRQQQDQKKAADQQRQPGDRDQKAAQGRDQKRVQVSDQQRTSVREHVTRDRNIERINRSRLNININVGTTIPRSVRLHTLPTTLVSTVPAYRDYSYIVLEDDTICVVDPRTYVIVDVIDTRGGGMRAERSGGGQLTLSQEDMRFIYRTVPKDRTANVRVRLALGAEVPRDVELYDFPAEVVERVPDVRRYRYVVAEDEIVIVDPNDYNVALVVNE